jgi:pimeloyl-ACP methyl ester carboxylesterase
MTAEEITIPCGKYDWLWAWHDRVAVNNKEGRGEKDKDSDKLAIMVHGFPGDHKSYGDVFSDLSAAFTSKGFHTLRFDMRGCGRSDKGSTFFSYRTAAEDCVNVLQWTEKLGYKKLYLIAEGLGAPIALTILGDRIRPKIAGVVFLWPILAAQNSGLKKMVTDQPELFSETFIDEIDAYNFTPLMQRLTMPTMVICGSADTMAPPATQAEILKSHMTENNLEILTFEGGTHGLKTAVERDFLMKQINFFIRQHS